MAQKSENQGEKAPATHTTQAASEAQPKHGLLRGQILRFGVVGMIGFVVNASLVEALAHATGPLLAQALAFPVAASATWWLNRTYTFGASNQQPHHEWLRYMLANSVGWLVNNAVFIAVVLTVPVAYAHPSIAVAVGSVAGMFFNFVASKKLVFTVDSHLK